MRPLWSISADGTDVTERLAAYLLSLSIRDQSGMEPDELAIEVADPEALIALPRLGTRLSVRLGYEHTGAAEMGEYVVDAVELAAPPRQISIRAHSAELGGALKDRKSRGWDDKTVGEVAEEIAGEHGLEPVIELQLKSYSAKRIDQTNESDISLLTRLGQMYDALVTVKAGRLVMTPRGRGTAVSGAALDPRTLRPAQVTSWRLSIADAERVKTVQAQWRDRDSGETVWVEADVERGGETEGGEGSVYRLRQTFPDEASAQKAAQARASAAVRSETELTLTLPGSPVYGAESPLTLEGFCAELDGRWIATEVTHRLEVGGYSCEIRGERP